MNGSGWAPIDTSVTAKRTRNPIREVVETIHPPATPHKPIIPLSLGAVVMRDDACVWYDALKVGDWQATRRFSVT
jgi:hypothetical protein